MRSIENLTKGDYIAFYVPKEGIIVDNITDIYNDGRFLVHYLLGYKGESAEVKPEEVLAIGNLESGKTKISGWSGRFDVVNPKGLEEALSKE